MLSKVVSLCFNFSVIIYLFIYFLTVLDDEDEESVITTGSIVTVAVTLKRRNLGVSCVFLTSVAQIKTHSDFSYSGKKIRSLCRLIPTLFCEHFLIACITSVTAAPAMQAKQTPDFRMNL